MRNTDTESVREKWLNLKDRAEDMIEATATFIFEHPEEAVGIAGFIAGFLAVVIRKSDKYMDIYRANRLRESTIYDRSLGMYWETKRPLTTNQRLIIESRHKAGESYGSILSDMKLLKK